MFKAYTVARGSEYRRLFRSGFSLIELLVVIGIIAILTAILLPVFLSVRASSQGTQCVSNQRQLGVALLQYTQDNDGRFPRGTADGGDVPGRQTPPKNWDNLIFPYLKNRDVFHCPTCSVPGVISSPQPVNWPEHFSYGYGMNSRLQEDTETAPGIFLSQVPFPATTVAFGEFSYRANTGGGYEYPLTMTQPDLETDATRAEGTRFLGGAGALRHRGGSNYTFVDGHTKWYTPSQVHDSNTPNEGITPTFSL